MTSDIAATIRRTLLAQGVDVDVAAVRSAAGRSGVVVDERTMAVLAGDLAADLRGFGPLESFLADPAVTDVVVNGAHEVWVDRGAGMVLTGVRFGDERAVRRLAQRLAASCGRRLDDASPYVDAPLAAGVRLHAVLPPLADRASISIRVPRHRAWSLADLVASGVLSPRLHDELAALVCGRVSFLISGGTGSGKTTLLNSLLAEVHDAERIVIVEDTRELAPRHPHVVSLQTRSPNIERAGEVTMQDLVRQTLRMRPDRIVVGEVRGAEVIDLLTAMNTGHRGGCGTVHANSAADVLPRFEALAALGGVPSHALRPLLGAGLEAVVHLERDTSGRRRVAELAVLRSEPPVITVVPAFCVDASGTLAAGPGAQRWRDLVGPL
jgi:pilus assembly protein CpaF